MTAPTTMADLSATAASNYPSGSLTPSTLDDSVRALSSIVKQDVSIGSNIASATSITIPASGSYFIVTGTTTIASIAATNSWLGRRVMLKFNGALTLTHSSALICPGGVSISVVAGDSCDVVYESSGVWRVAAYHPYSTITIDVRRYGAVGNGSTDDSAAFQAASDALASRGGVIYVPRSTYKISAQVTFGPGVYLVGDGQENTRINAATDVSPFAWSDTTPSDVNGGGIIGMSISLDGAAVVGVAATHIWQFRCENIRFRDGPYSTALQLNGACFEAHVSQCRFAGFDDIGIEFEAADTLYANSTVIDAGNDFAPNDGAIAIRNKGADDVKVAFNHFEFAASEGGTFVYLDGVSNKMHFIGNHFGSNNSVSSVASIRISGSSHCNIVGNDFSLIAGNNIQIDSALSTLAFVIAGNTFDVTGGADAILITDRNNVAISGNTYRKTSSSTGNFVNLAGTAANISISGNCVSSSSATGAGINIASGVTLFSVVGNSITGLATGIVCDATAGSKTGVISANNLAGNTAAMTVASAGAVRVRDNTGYVTNTNGTGTINSGATSASVMHGLSQTPAAKDIVIGFTENPTNDPGNVWVSSVGATTFTVNVRNDPGASNLDFTWAASIP